MLKSKDFEGGLASGSTNCIFRVNPENACIGGTEVEIFLKKWSGYPSAGSG